MSLADELLADLDDLGTGNADDEEADNDAYERSNRGGRGAAAPAEGGKRRRSGDGDADGESDSDSESEDEDGDDNDDMDADGETTEEKARKAKTIGGLDIELISKANDIHAIAKLVQSRQLLDTLKKVEEFTAKPPAAQFTGTVEEHPEYKLVVQSNRLSVDIDNEVAVIHKFVRDHYAPKFPELESLVLVPLEYMRVVKAIGNAMDLTKVDLAAMLPATTVMVITVAATTTSGRQLAAPDLAKVIDACDMAIHLDECKKKLLHYVETRMSFIAPNLTIIVGSVIAAKLMGIAGGLTALSKIPACNVKVLGKDKKTLTGFSSTMVKAHNGAIFNCDLIQQTPPDLRQKAMRVISGKCTLAARVDSFHECNDGSMGKKLRDEIVHKIEKWQEPPPAKQIKPISLPDEAVRKRRGGKRARRAKGRIAMTELRKQANRVTFGVAEEEAFYGEETEGLGRLTGREQFSGSVRTATVDTRNKPNLTKKQTQQLKSYGGSSASGLSSSLVFTPVQGLELMNPELAAKKAKEANERYFGSTVFQKVAPTPAPAPKVGKDGFMIPSAVVRK